eukprot:13516793-Alexandrium_andersonii.AAC.1
MPGRSLLPHAASGWTVDGEALEVCVRSQACAANDTRHVVKLLPCGGAHQTPKAGDDLAALVRVQACVAVSSVCTPVLMTPPAQ